MKMSPLFYGAAFITLAAAPLMVNFEAAGNANQKNPDAEQDFRSPKIDDTGPAIVLPESTEATRQKTLLQIAANSRSANYVILGDSNHSDLALRKFNLSRELMRTLAAEKFEYVAVEFPLSMQPLIDAYASGEISRKSFIATAETVLGGRGVKEYNEHISGDDHIGLMEDLAGFIEEGQKTGVRILASDSLQGADVPKSYLPFQGERYLAFARFLDRNPYGDQHDQILLETEVALENFVNEYNRAANERALKKPPGSAIALMEIPDEDESAIRARLLKDPKTLRKMADIEAMDRYDSIAEIYKSWRVKYDLENEYEAPVRSREKEINQLKQRLREDDDLAAFIKEATRGKKTFVIYGIAHALHGSGSLADKLNASVIMLFRNGVDEASFIKSCINGNALYTCAGFRNHAAIHLDTGETSRPTAYANENRRQFQGLAPG